MGVPVDDLLTTRQLQNLLQVDRITIYRMLDDGRLKGFKVGGQWRFSRAELESWLMQQRVAPESDETPRPVPQPLPLHCVQAIQSVFAEAMGLAAVTTDLSGSVLTEVSNSCGFCDLILGSAEGQGRCAATWRSLDRGEVRRCHAGLLCGGARITVNGEPVAVTAGCQFIRAGSGEALIARLPVLAVELGVPEDDLRAAVEHVPQLPDESCARVPQLLRRVAATFSDIGQERLALLDRLQRIAEITTFQA